MPTTRCVRKAASLLIPYVGALLLQACGGGGGGGGGGSVNSPSPSGPTPFPTDTPTPVRAGGNIKDALKRALPGSTVVVAPGLYGPIVLDPGDLQGPVTLLADTTGGLTESPSFPVTINAHGAPAAIMVSGQTGLTIDGFTLRGGAVAGVVASNSPQTTVRNCIVTGNTGDGVRLEQSDDALVFDNLVYGNPGAGIQVLGSNGALLINNTLYGNKGNAIFVGDATQPSASVVVENNIVNTNTPIGIVVDGASTDGYQGDFNLNTDGYGDETPVGVDDFAANPLFILPSGGDFHVLGPDEFLGGGSPVIDAGDPEIDPDLAATLEARSIQSDGTLDVSPVDIGYHYIAPQAFTPTPLQVRTRTSTPLRGTPTRTPTGPTRTPTHTPTETPPGGRTPKPTRTPRPL